MTERDLPAIHENYREPYAAWLANWPTGTPDEPYWPAFADAIDAAREPLVAEVAQLRKRLVVCPDCQGGGIIPGDRAVGRPNEFCGRCDHTGEIADDVAALAEFARWLLTLDDPEDAVGRADRQVVTLTGIVEQARQALGKQD